VTAECRRLGWTVLRFWEHSIRRDFEGCQEKVLKALKTTRRTGVGS
jgi:very-short-patch-repair endonuclease